jgi:hypothetical protein
MVLRSTVKMDAATAQSWRKSSLVTPYEVELPVIGLDNAVQQHEFRNPSVDSVNHRSAKATAFISAPNR